jgi:hypothetical protein
MRYHATAAVEALGHDTIEALGHGLGLLFGRRNEQSDPAVPADQQAPYPALGNHDRGEPNWRVNALMADAAKCNAPMHAVMKAWVERVGGKYDEGPLKTRDRVMEKAYTDYGRLAADYRPPTTDH